MPVSSVSQMVRRNVLYMQTPASELLVSVFDVSAALSPARNYSHCGCGLDSGCRASWMARSTCRCRRRRARENGSGMITRGRSCAHLPTMSWTCERWTQHQPRLPSLCWDQDRKCGSRVVKVRTSKHCVVPISCDCLAKFMQSYVSR